MNITITDKQLLATLGVLIRRKIQTRIRAGETEPKTNKPKWQKGKRSTLVNTTKLLKSINYKVVDNNTLIISAGGPGIPYARILHEGGTITPKRAKFLTIPLCAEAAAKRARDFDNIFIRKGIIYQNLEDGKIRALYVLKKQVTIPARPYLYLKSNEIEEIQKELFKTILDRIKRSFKRAETNR